MADKNPNAAEGTWSAKPFISHDGVLNNVRAEVKVVMGYGDILDVTDSKGGKSKKVEFQVRTTEFFPSGWTRDEKIQAVIEKAKETGEPVHFRIETRRKDDIDREKPFSELVTDRGKEIVKSLAAVKLEGDEAWTISADAVTRFDEDPQVAGGLVKAGDQNIEDLRPAPRTESSGNSRNSAYEPAPYVGRWRGQINPGGIGVSIPGTFLANLLEHQRSTGVDLDEERAREIAHVLLRIANALQKAIYIKHLKADWTGVDLTAGSHTRARALIFETMRSFEPLTEKELDDVDDFNEWQKRLYSKAYEQWVWAIELAEEFVS